MQILIQKIAIGKMTNKFFLKYFIGKGKKRPLCIFQNPSKKWSLFLSFFLKKLIPYYEIPVADNESYRSLIKLEEYKRGLINFEKKRKERNSQHE